MFRLKIEVVLSAHTEGMYLTLPPREIDFRICKVIFPIALKLFDSNFMGILRLGGVVLQLTVLLHVPSLFWRSRR